MLTHQPFFAVPICMPADTADFTGRMATVTGWGRLKYGGGVPTVMQEVQVSDFFLFFELGCCLLGKRNQMHLRDL